ncbi:unnamed protein product, partial [Trichogramma brassicae]
EAQLLLDQSASPTFHIRKCFTRYTEFRYSNVLDRVTEEQKLATNFSHVRPLRGRSPCRDAAVLGLHRALPGQVRHDAGEQAGAAAPPHRGAAAELGAVGRHPAALPARPRDADAVAALAQEAPDRQAARGVRGAAGRQGLLPRRLAPLRQGGPTALRAQARPDGRQGAAQVHRRGRAAAAGAAHPRGGPAAHGRGDQRLGPSGLAVDATLGPRGPEYAPPLSARHQGAAAHHRDRRGQLSRDDGPGPHIVRAPLLPDALDAHQHVHT